MTQRFIRYDIYHSSEDAIREQQSEYDNKVPVYYGDNTYNHSVQNILNLCNAIKEDFPDVKLEDMEVRTISNYKSDRHARITMVCVRIPIDDYIKMRNANQIHVL